MNFCACRDHDHRQPQLYFVFPIITDYVSSYVLADLLSRKANDSTIAFCSFPLGTTQDLGNGEYSHRHHEH